VSYGIVRYLRQRLIYVAISKFESLWCRQSSYIRAMSTVDVHAASPHAILGIIIFTVTAFQIALGLLAIWGWLMSNQQLLGRSSFKTFMFLLGGYYICSCM
ncbi:8957_t:CDS:2, partial [Funneliformis caledonium]